MNHVSALIFGVLEELNSVGLMRSQNYIMYSYEEFPGQPANNLIWKLPVLYFVILCELLKYGGCIFVLRLIR